MQNALGKVPSAVKNWLPGVSKLFHFFKKKFHFFFVISHVFCSKIKRKKVVICIAYKYAYSLNIVLHFFFFFFQNTGKQNNRGNSGGQDLLVRIRIYIVMPSMVLFHLRSV